MILALNSPAAIALFAFDQPATERLKTQEDLCPT